MSSDSRYHKFFGEYFNENWINFGGFEEYFNDVICNLTPDKFIHEKQKWEEEEGRLLDYQKSLAFKHYHSFVTTSVCSNDIRTSFDTLEEQLESVVETVPMILNSLSECSKLAVHTNKMRKEANMSIIKHPQILEILELPQLIDTSIRNNFFEEGLELHGFVTGLSAKFTDIPIIQMIKKESDACITNMEEILMKQLQGQISLAQCLKSVGLLRRIGTDTDTQLKVKFLRVRTEWFRNVISNINKDEIQYYMCKMIDSYRVNLFDIITQYRSVFIEDKSAGLIFNSWLHQQVSYFLQLLNENLPRCSGAILDSTLAQSMYFGMSLGRVGTDFRGVLVPLFQQRILQLCISKVEAATAAFLLTSDTLLDVTYHGDPTLVNITPLAQYTNSLINLLNELRHCAPVSLNLNLAQQIQNSLMTVIRETVNKLEDHPAEVEKYSTIIVLEMLPLIDNNFKTVFRVLPEIYNHRTFGSESFKNKTKLSLDLTELQAPLRPFLSPATKILLSDLPFTVADEEDVSNITSMSGEKVTDDDVTIETSDVDLVTDNDATTTDDAANVDLPTLDDAALVADDVTVADVDDVITAQQTDVANAMVTGDVPMSAAEGDYSMDFAADAGIHDATDEGEKSVSEDTQHTNLQHEHNDSGSQSGTSENESSAEEVEIAIMENTESEIEGSKAGQNNVQN